MTTLAVRDPTAPVSNTAADLKGLPGSAGPADSRHGFHGLSRDPGCRGMRHPAPPEGEAMKITDTSDLWWKNAIIYCLDVETYLDSDGDGTGDLQGLAQRIDYLAQLGRDLPVADAVLSDARSRRRVRHHRFLRRGPAPGQSRRLRGGHPHSPRSRHAGDRGPGRQPHVRPASVVSEGQAQRELAVPRLLHLARRSAAQGPEEHGVPRRGRRHLDQGRRLRAVVPAQLLRAPARPQHRESRGARRTRRA